MTTRTRERCRTGTILAPTTLPGGTTPTTHRDRIALNPARAISGQPLKTAVILDSEFNSTHAMDGVLDRRGFAVLRAGTIEEAIKRLKSAEAPVDLVIVEVPLSGSDSQTEAAVQIHLSSPEIPILLVSDLALEKWHEDDFLQFGQLLSGRIDLLVKPLSQASFMSKANALIYTISYSESKRLYESAALRRKAATRV
jgi:response regulator RpfG family c-di-GMP phosphodiesterase